MLERLHLWIDAIKERGRRSWWWLLILLVIALLQNRIYDWINEQIDAQSSAFLLSVRDAAIWSTNDTLGWVGLVLAGTVLFIIIAAFVETSYFRKSQEPPPSAEEPDDILPEEEPQPPSPPICPIEFEEGTYSEIGNYTPDFKAGLGSLGLALGIEQAAKAPIAQRIYEIGIHNKLKTQTVRSVRVELESVEKLPQIDEDDDYSGASIGVPIPWGNTLNFASGVPSQDFTGDMRDKIALVSHSKGGGSREDTILIHCLNRSFQHQGHKHLLNLKVTADGYQAGKTQFKVWIARDGMLKMKHLSLRNRMVEDLMRKPR